jgi:AraC-like DNA-binding protein
MVFASDALSQPLETADPNLLAILVPAAETLAGTATPDALLSDQVRRAIKKALRQEDTDIEAIARTLGMTARTLQRRLKDEGASFQALRDETRRAQAEAYLRQGMSFAEISFLLGFSEPSVFFRAFKRWTGTTPLEERTRLRTAGASA